MWPASYPEAVRTSIMTGRLAGSSYSALKSSMLMRGTSASVEPDGTVGCTVRTGGTSDGIVGPPVSTAEPVPLVGCPPGSTFDGEVGTSVGKLVIGVGTGAVGVPGLLRTKIMTPMPTTRTAISAPIT